MGDGSLVQRRPSPGFLSGLRSGARAKLRRAASSRVEVRPVPPGIAPSLERQYCKAGQWNRLARPGNGLQNRHPRFESGVRAAPARAHPPILRPLLGSIGLRFCKPLLLFWLAPSELAPALGPVAKPSSPVRVRGSRCARSSRPIDSADNLLHYPRFLNSGQSLIEPLELECQPAVVDPE